MVRSTQPQAMAVFYSERLPFRRNQALGDASWHTEGTETVTELLQGRLLRQVEGIEAAWCASAADASLLAGLGRHEGRHASAPCADRQLAKGFADREGVALVATDSFDVAADAEDPAMRALDELVPAWRRRDIEPAGQGRQRLAHAGPRPHGRPASVPRSYPPVGTSSAPWARPGWWWPRSRTARAPRRGCRRPWPRARPGCALPRRSPVLTWRPVLRRRPRRRSSVEGRCLTASTNGRWWPTSPPWPTGAGHCLPTRPPGATFAGAISRAPGRPGGQRGAVPPRRPAGPGSTCLRPRCGPVERWPAHPATPPVQGGPAAAGGGRPARHFRPRQPERRRALRAVAPSAGGRTPR